MRSTAVPSRTTAAYGFRACAAAGFAVWRASRNDEHNSVCYTYLRRAGLDPATHLLLREMMFSRATRAMDTRVKPAYDVAECCDALLPINLSNSHDEFVLAAR
jgi:hypothetical protein